MSKIGKPRKVDEWLLRAGSLGKKEWRMTVNGYRFLFRVMKVFWN